MPELAVIREVQNGARQTAPTVGVVGGGTMGSGIAHSALVAGSPVILLETDAEAGRRAATRIQRTLETAAGRSLLARPVSDVLVGLSITTDVSDLRESWLVIEAVPESVDLKHSVLATIEAAVSTDATIATNTSSLSIDLLASGMTDPARLVGMHFFNPVPASQLVEIVCGARTSPASRAAAHEFAGLVGLQVINVADRPGFATSRLGVALGLEAMRMVEEGVAQPEDIDKAMVLAYKHPIGPLKLTDLVGLDVRLGIAEYLTATLGPRFEPPMLMRTMIAAGHLGKKTGRGFYEWT